MKRDHGPHGLGDR